MNKEEAIQALKEGKKLTHRFFDSHEYITQKGGQMVMEDNAAISVQIFWQDRRNSVWNKDWEIFANGKLE